MNWLLIIALAAGLALIVLTIKAFFAPIRLTLRLLINSALGAALLWLINLAGQAFGLHIGVNPVTALVVGLLGIPGVLLLLVLHFIIGA